MDYENISDEEVCRLLKQAAPHVKIGEITDSNRELVVPFLRVLLWMITWDRLLPIGEALSPGKARGAETDGRMI